MKDFLLKKCDSCKKILSAPLKRHSESRVIILYLLVGAVGFAFNLGILTLALYLHLPVKSGIILGILASTLLIFILDRYLVFAHARSRPLFFQALGFIIVCLLGGTTNYFCALAMLSKWPGLYIQIAESIGALAGATFNYLLLRFVIFAK